MAAVPATGAPVHVSTFAGSVPGSQDGYRTEATFSVAGALAIGPDGRIFVGEALIPDFTTAGVGAQRIRVIDQAGNVSTFAGSDQPGLVEGFRTSARFRGPNSIVFDRSGNMFVVDRLNHRIRKIDPSGMVSTFVGSTAGYQDGAGSQAMFNSPIGMCIDANDNLYVADFENIVIRKVTPRGEVTTYAGTAGNRGTQDGPRATATFNSPVWVSLSPHGDLFVADWLNGRIRKITSDGTVSTFASDLTYIELVAVDSAGAVYASIPPGAGSHRFIKFNAGGAVQWTLANEPGFQDGPAAQARFAHFAQPIFLSNGNILMTDMSRLRLIEFDTTGECVQPTSGLVGWWPGEGSAAERIQGQDGTALGGLTYGPGKVGQAFRFDGVDDRVRVPKSLPLIVGSGAGLTLEAWISPAELVAQQPIVEWNSGTAYGAHFYISVISPWGRGPGCLYANLVDTDRVDHVITSEAGVVQANTFQHVALTYDQASGEAALYVNGLPVAQASLGHFTPETRYDLWLGYRLPGFDGSPFAFNGAMDEVGVYNRALSAAEIAAIYGAGAAGKCQDSQPTQRTFDLRADWSEDANPNGPWSFRAGEVVLPRVENWTLDTFNPPQGGWAFGSTIPFWFRSSAPAPGGIDWVPGDVVVHTHTPYTFNGPENGLANVVWTSPFAAVVTITGGVWEARDIPSLNGGLRGNRWNLYIRDRLISSGVISGGDPYTRQRPLDFALGSGGPTAVQGVPLSAGDQIRLEFVPTSAEGDYVGVNLTISGAANRPSFSGVSNLAGNGTVGYADGPGASASFASPNGGFVRDGKSYIADTLNHRIRTVEIPSGVVATLAGSGLVGYVDGPALQAQFSSPLGVWVDSSANVYVADTENNRIRKVSAGPNRQVTTVAGSGERGYLDGPVAVARFDFPDDLTMDAAGNLYVTEFNNHTVRQITPDGKVRTVAGYGRIGFEDGLGTAAGLNQPAGLAIDPQGILFVTEWGSHRIRRIDTSGRVSTFAGTVFPGLVNGLGLQARFNQPDGIAVGPAGDLFVAEHGNHTIRRITTDGTVTVFAGTGAPGDLDGLATAAKFNAPGGVGVDSSGRVIVADTGNNRVRLIQVQATPSVTIEPASQSAMAGTDVAFRAVPSALGPWQYHWFFNGSIVAEATESVLKLAAVRPTQTGRYIVELTSPAGTVESAAATLTVLPQIQYARELPAYYAPGTPFSVRLSSIPDIAGASYAYAVEDAPPKGWLVGAVSDGGSYDPLTQRVKFGPFFDFGHAQLSYEVTPPPLASGQQFFVGVVSAAGLSNPVTGLNSVLPPLLHPADVSAPEFRIGINELTAYAGTWRRGQSWSVGPNPIPLDYVTRAGWLWKNGEVYRFDPTVPMPPLWWTEVRSAPSAGPAQVAQSFPGLEVNLSRAVRALPFGFLPDEPFAVRVEVTPASASSVYAVEERVPQGVIITSVSDGGEPDPRQGMIRWGPYFDSKPRTLSYEATSTLHAVSLLSFSGRLSVDGQNSEIEGAVTTRLGFRLTGFRLFENGDRVLELGGANQPQVYQVETSMDLRVWEPLGWSTNSGGILRFRDPDPGRAPHRFYRAKN